MSNEQIVEELYKEYGPSILNYLKRTIRLSEHDAADVLQETFAKVFLNIEKVCKADNQKAYIFTMAKNVALFKLKDIQRFITNVEKPQKDDDDSNENYSLEKIEESIEVAKKMERQLCLQLCLEKALNTQKARCPLVVTLAEHKYSINEIATIIYRTPKETEDILKDCHEEMANYQDLNKYQKIHGLESLCWLIAFLKSKDLPDKEIAKILNKTDDATRKTVARCRESMKNDTKLKKCRDDC